MRPSLHRPCRPGLWMAARFAGRVGAQRCISIIRGISIMLWFRFAMIHSEPAISRKTMSTPKASASTLLVLSGPVVMWRKNTMYTHLRDRQHDEGDRNDRHPDDTATADIERGHGQPRRHRQADEIAEDAVGDAAPVEPLVPGRSVVGMGMKVVDELAHAAAPSR